jgi:uncharacterized membrane protein
VERGPLEVIVLSFPEERVPEGVEAALDAMRQVGDIRLVSGMTVTRPVAGDPVVTQLAAFDDVGDVVADIVAHQAVGLFDAADVEEAIATIDPGSTAVLVLIEHVWAVGIAAEIRAAEGQLVDAVRLSRQVLRRAEEDLGQARSR